MELLGEVHPMPSPAVTGLLRLIRFMIMITMTMTMMTMHLEYLVLCF